MRFNPRSLAQLMLPINVHRFVRELSVPDTPSCLQWQQKSITDYYRLCYTWLLPQREMVFFGRSFSLELKYSFLSGCAGNATTPMLNIRSIIDVQFVTHISSIPQKTSLSLATHSILTLSLCDTTMYFVTARQLLRWNDGVGIAVIKVVVLKVYLLPVIHYFESTCSLVVLSSRCLSYQFFQTHPWPAIVQLASTYDSGLLSALPC